MKSDVYSNKLLWEQYTSRRANQFRKSGAALPELPSVAERSFLYDVLVFWQERYYGRQIELQRKNVADTVAKDILIERIRARNALYSTLPDLPAEQFVYVQMVASVLNTPLEPRIDFRGLDVSTFRDIPSYGPSFISLWEDAKKQGFSPEQIAHYICNWGKFRPPAWSRELDRKAKKQPLIDRKVTKRLTEVTAWRRTGDLNIPWNADVNGHQWQLQLNDFPDDYMYTLLIDGRVLGDFH